MTQLVLIWLCDFAGNKFNTEAMTHSASPDYFCAAPSHLSDTDTGWYWRTQSLPGYWQVDLGDSKTIGIVKIQGSETANRMIKDFTVSSSEDGEAFTPFLSKQAAQSLDLQTFSAF